MRANDREPGPRLGSARVSGSRVVDVEPRSPNECERVAGQVAASRKTLLNRFEAPLPAGNPSVRGAAVFDDAQLPTWSQDPGDLSERTCGIGNRAQSERGEGPVHRFVPEAEVVSVGADVLDRERGCGDAVGSARVLSSNWLDSKYAVHLGRVQGNVEP